MNLAVANSAVSKGETLLDTARNIAAMRPDCLILRHQAAGATAQNQNPRHPSPPGYAYRVPLLPG